MITQPDLRVDEIWFMIPPGKHCVREAQILNVNGTMVTLNYPSEGLSAFGFKDPKRCYLITDVRWIGKTLKTVESIALAKAIRQAQADAVPFPAPGRE